MRDDLSIGQIYRRTQPEYRSARIEILELPDDYVVYKCNGAWDVIGVSRKRFMQMIEKREIVYDKS